MKRILLCFALLLCVASFGQTSEYNKTTKFEQKYGYWAKINNGTEMFLTNQNPVGYKKTYDELKRILEFYSLDLMESVSDNSLIPNGASMQDFTQMSNNIYLEMAEVNMVWKTKDGVLIFFICNKDTNSVTINPKK